MKDFDGQNWKKWNFQFKVALKSACAQVFHLVTKERRESEDAMVKIAVLGATSLHGGDLGQRRRRCSTCWR